MAAALLILYHILIEDVQSIVDDHNFVAVPHTCETCIQDDDDEQDDDEVKFMYFSYDKKFNRYHIHCKRCDYSLILPPKRRLCHEVKRMIMIQYEDYIKFNIYHTTAVIEQNKTNSGGSSTSHHVSTTDLLCDD